MSPEASTPRYGGPGRADLVRADRTYARPGDPGRPARPAGQVVTARVAAGRLYPATVVRLTGHRAHVSGSLAQIDEQLAAWTRAGRLVRAGDPYPDGRPGIHAVVVQLTAPIQPHGQAAQVRRVDRHRLGGGTRLAIAGGVFVTVAAVVFWAIATALAWIAAHVVVVVVAAAVVLFVATPGGRRTCKTVITITHRH